ncbi:hypothetical protein DFQ04_0414 [Algoriphagus boseongensis]|uniref:Uncharacterized protein n=1 Tax=Algoriphagus boseongensis TaxID=1442587 RepID=A0A4R6T8Q2_9BACT|nr:hypothetical protein [Algoriphagus boseongensis]TDQ18609.1 hypothetical protein DFQ04_0414 [Algoriphagus boseongensis]
MRKSTTQIIESLPALRTSDLKYWETVSNQYLSGRDNSLLPYWVTYELSSEGLILNYYLNGSQSEQFIEILFEPSNLGIGDVWYFSCPASGRRCRKLVLWKGKFVHQSSIDHVFYRQQTQSLPERTSKKWIRKYGKYLELLSQQEKPYYKPTYAGYSTKLAVRATQALHRYAIAIQNQNEVWAWFGQKPKNQG